MKLLSIWPIWKSEPTFARTLDQLDAGGWSKAEGAISDLGDRFDVSHKVAATNHVNGAAIFQLNDQLRASRIRLPCIEVFHRERAIGTQGEVAQSGDGGFAQVDVLGIQAQTAESA